MSFSSERLSEFRGLVSWLVSQGAGHCQPYVNPRITLVLGLIDDTGPNYTSLLVHFGGDSDIGTYRPNLYFYDNTVVTIVNQSAA